MNGQDKKNLHHYQIQGALPPAIGTVLSVLMFSITGEEPSPEDIEQVTNLSNLFYSLFQEHGVVVVIILFGAVTVWGFINGGKGKTSTSPADREIMQNLTDSNASLGDQLAKFIDERDTWRSQLIKSKSALHEANVKIKVLEKAIEQLKPS